MTFQNGNFPVGNGKHRFTDAQIIAGMLEHLRRIIAKTTDESARMEAVMAVELTGPHPVVTKNGT